MFRPGRLALVGIYGTKALGVTVGPAAVRIQTHSSLMF